MNLSQNKNETPTGRFCDSPSIEEMAQSILSGQLVIFPCDTIWGIIGLAQPETAIQLATLKERPLNQGFVVLIPHQGHLNHWVSPITDLQKSLMAKFWPGPLTMVFQSAAAVCSNIKGDHSGIAIRHPRFPILNQLLDLLDTPLISSSLNLHQQATIQDIQDIPAAIKHQVSMIYPYATPLHQKASTIIDCQGTTIKIIREGSISREDLAPYLS